MAKDPIRWNNIAQPNLDLSGAGVALRGFGQSSEGFDRLTGRLLEMDAMEARNMTNQQIALSMQGGGGGIGSSPFKGPINPRIDAAAVYDVWAHKQALDSDLRTAITGRNSTRADTARTRIQGLQDQFDLAHAPLLWDREAQAARDASAESGANVAQSQAATARDNLVTQQLKRKGEIEEQQNKAVLDLEDILVADQDKYFQEEMQTVKLIEEAQKAKGMTDEEWQKQLPTRMANARGLAADRFAVDMPTRAAQLAAEYNLPRDVFSQTGYGAMLDAFEATAKEDVLARSAEERETTKNRRKFLNETATGAKMTGVALDNNGNTLILSDPNDVAANTVTGNDAIKSHIGKSYNITEKTDAAKAATFGSILGGNVSYMDWILKQHPATGYFDDEGTIDWDAAIQTAKNMAPGISKAAQDELTRLPEDTGPISNDDILLKLQQEEQSAAATAAKGGGETPKDEEEVIPPVSNTEIAKKLAAPESREEADKAVTAFQQNLLRAERELKDIPEEVQKRHLTDFKTLQNTLDYAAGRREKLETPRDSFDPIEADRSRKLRPHEKAEELDNFATLLKKIRDQEAEFQRQKKERDLRDYVNESL